MSTSTLVDRLVALPDLAGIPRDQLQWLAVHGTVQQQNDGWTLSGMDAMTGLMLLISGRFSIRAQQHGVAREVRSVTAGRVTGPLPHSTITNPRGYLVAAHRGSVDLVSRPGRTAFRVTLPAAARPAEGAGAVESDR